MVGWRGVGLDCGLGAGRGGNSIRLEGSRLGRDTPETVIEVDEYDGEKQKEM